MKTQRRHNTAGLIGNDTDVDGQFCFRSRVVTDPTNGTWSTPPMARWPTRQLPTSTVLTALPYEVAANGGVDTRNGWFDSYFNDAIYAYQQQWLNGESYDNCNK